MLIFGCLPKEQLLQRLKHAKHQEQTVSFVVFSGNPKEAAIFEKQYKTNLPTYIDSKSQNTIDNVVHTTPFFRKGEFKIIISSAYHLNRIKFIITQIFPQQAESLRFSGCFNYPEERLICEKRIQADLEWYKNMILKTYQKYCELKQPINLKYITNQEKIEQKLIDVYLQ